MHNRLLKYAIIIILKLALALPVIGQSAADWYLQGLGEIHKGNLKKAQSCFDNAIQQSPREAKFHLRKAEVFFRQNDYENTIQSCYKALEVEPNNPEAYIIRGKVGAATNSLEAAGVFYNKALKYALTDSFRHIALCHLGDLYLLQNKMTEAENSYQRAHQIIPGDARTMLALAEVFLRTGHKEKAIELTDSVLATTATYYQALAVKASILSASHEYQQAIETLNAYLSVVPNDGQVLLNLCELYLLAGNYSMAQITINKAFTYLPAEPRLFKLNSDAHFATGNSEEGCNNLFKAFQLGYLDQYGYDALEKYVVACECQAK